MRVGLMGTLTHGLVPVVGTDGLLGGVAGVPALRGVALDPPGQGGPRSNSGGAARPFCAYAPLRTHFQGVFSATINNLALVLRGKRPGS